MSEFQWDILLLILIAMNFCWTMYLYHSSQLNRCVDMKKIWEFLEKYTKIGKNTENDD